MPVPIQTNAHVQALIDQFRILGGFRLQLDETVIPVALVSDLADPGDRYAIGGYRFAAVANIPHICLYNPPGSGVRVFLDEVVYTQNVTNIFEMYRDAALVNASTILSFQQLTPDLTIAPRAQVRYEDNVAALGAAVTDGRIAANSIQRFPLNVELAENRSWGIRTQAAGTIMEAYFRWRERPA